ncbi:MAG: GspH/FimT family pseudopilin [Cyanobacteriota bacterium]
MHREPGWTLPETLLVAAVLVVTGTQLWRGGADTLARQRLTIASQRVTGGLEVARAAALRLGQPCGLRLGRQGWEPPGGTMLPACAGVEGGLGVGVEGAASDPEVTHNLPDPVRFSANGLVLDGGTVWLRSRGTSLVRCVVVSLPLGITRVGREGGGGCVPEISP